jgi:type VI secretion system secreted protein Hcp
MPLTGYLEIDEIAGESTQVDHEDQIDVYGVSWKIEQTVSSVSGRTRSRADMGPLVAHKYYDAASPYLAKAVEQGRAFPEARFYAATESGGTQLDYLVITMTNVIVVSYGFANEDPEGPEDRLAERVEIDFEKADIKYARDMGGGTSGDEHEVSLGGAARATAIRSFAPR